MHNKYQADKLISVLAENFPKCFWEHPKRRLPLKKGIEADLINSGECRLDDDEIASALFFYRGHIQYLNSMQAGVHRIDLNGEKSGTVTKTEADNAQKKVQEIVAKTREQRQSMAALDAPKQDPTAWRTLAKMHQKGQVADDVFSSVDAGPVKIEQPPDPQPSHVLPSLITPEPAPINGSKSDIVVEEGIPIPGPKTKAFRDYNDYPWEKMKIGSSFFVKAATKNEIAAVRSAVTYRQKHTGERFKSRSDPGGVRVWRINPEK